MNDILTIHGYAFDKSLVVAIVVVCLLLTIALVVVQGSLVGPAQLKFSNRVVSEAYVDVNEYCGSQDDEVMQLAFCSNENAVVNAKTKEVIARYNAGSQNYRLLAYLFDNPNKTISERDLASEVNPASPDSFYIRKAICNLKLDKELRSKMFTVHGSNQVVLNTEIPMTTNAA
ncbi:hypothetical protein BCT94_05480 [Vibrio breoganii]|uniref:Uncharacterized protein n=1 Tax=Vibrio breoganii TaxID=553239 RepID=A0AAP8MYM2_9VIBR|nr:helix-turn-helix domain-containing protein [Vibrio breoganii]PMK78539.1 hypothetical protein BCT94_05480 [Vibrio breoganii]PMP14019.1 hypothetical protein BCS93_04315 [Vibrio breoganii]